MSKKYFNIQFLKNSIPIALSKLVDKEANKFHRIQAAVALDGTLKQINLIKVLKKDNYDKIDNLDSIESIVDELVMCVKDSDGALTKIEDIEGVEDILDEKKKKGGTDDITIINTFSRDKMSCSIFEGTHYGLCPKGRKGSAVDVTLLKLYQILIMCLKTRFFHVRFYDRSEQNAILYEENGCLRMSKIYTDSMRLDTEIAANIAVDKKGSKILLDKIDTLYPIQDELVFEKEYDYIAELKEVLPQVVKTSSKVIQGDKAIIDLLKGL